MRSTHLKTFGLVAGALAAAGAARAADLPLRTAPPVFAAVPVINIDDWSGVYVGTTYGYGFNSFHNRQLGPAPFTGSQSRDVDGQAGGALVGYNFQYGHYVFGAEGSIDLNVIRGNTGGVVGAFNPVHDDQLYDIRFRGLLGYEFGRFMPFIAGGAVFNETYVSGTGAPVLQDFGATQQSVGWTAGAGLEYKLFPQELFPGLPSWLFGPVTLRGEYLYQSLPSRTYAFGGQTYRTRSDGSFIRGALIYRFGDNPPRPYADAAGDVNWAGGYGGIMGGYGSPNVQARFPGAAARPTIHADGGLGGIYAGTNFMFGRFMLGFDGSTSFTDLTGSQAFTPLAGGDNVSYRGYVDADIRARAGYAFGNFLPFVAIGYSFARGEIIDNTAAPKSERGRIPLDAFRVGGGLDYRLTQRVSLRIEDVYDFASTRKGTSLNNGVETPFSVTRDGNTVRAGLAYHFE